MAVTDAHLPDAATARRLQDLAAGLQVVIRFHDREVDPGLIAELRRHGIAEGLAELFDTAEGREAAGALAKALDQLGPVPDGATLDELAAEYADLYLTHGYRLAPSGSVWLTEDKLERQLPMFEVRDWYAHYDIAVPDWRIRADDHLVHELEFVAGLCQRGRLVAARDAARFLDLHVLPWVPEFCQRAADRVSQPFYAAVLRLTAAILDTLRDLLEEVTGQPRAIRPLPAPAAAAPELAQAAYVPGTSESW